MYPLDPALVDCVTNGREPTVGELFGMAGRIWCETAAERSAFAWEQLEPASEQRVVAIRLPLTAMRGAAQD